jgi:diaminopimelate epimerase
VEAETLACGTGSTASALVANAKYGIGNGQVEVKTSGGEQLKIYFTRKQSGYSGVWLEGKTRTVYEGEYHV